jgi:DsbC/DsbD-like thiol-disulfide interchange protein
MASSRFSAKTALWFAAAALIAQTPSTGVLAIAPPAKVTVKRTAGAEQRLKLHLQSGYHMNSNTPGDSYLIPLKLTWGEGPLEAEGVAYPKPKMEKFEFSEKPMSIYDGEVELVTKFKAKPGATPGPAVQLGKLRYQACTDKMCLPPKNLDVRLPVLVE